MNRFAEPDDNDVECDMCKGDGWVQGEESGPLYKCRECNGTGYVKALPRKSGNVDPDPEIERNR